MKTSSMHSPTPANSTGDRFSLRMVYPYLLRYGDPLLGSNVDEDISDGYLTALANAGVNAIWFQGVLQKLAPWDVDPDLSVDWEQRLANLRKLDAPKASVGKQVNQPLHDALTVLGANNDLRTELEAIHANVTRHVLALSTLGSKNKTNVRHVAQHLIQAQMLLGEALAKLEEH